MDVEPETKDWTWVLTRRCPQCGENVGTLAVPEMVSKLRSLAPQWKRTANAPGAALRPNPNTWSPLEYAAHVRDALAVFAERVELMLTRDSPTFPDWDQNAAALAGNYQAAEPNLVAVEVENAIEASALLLERLEPATYERRGLRSDGASFTVQTLAQYFVHDVAHHLDDAQRQ